MFKRICALSALTLTLIISNFGVAAAIDLSVSQSLVKLSAKPGETISIKLDATNSTTSTIPYDMVMGDFETTDNGSPKLLFGGQNKNYGMNKWRPKAEPIQLKSGKNAVQFDVKVPIDAEKKTYYSTLLFKDKRDSNGLAQTLGTIVFVSVSDPQPEITFKDIELKNGALKFSIYNAGKGNAVVTPAVTSKNGEKIISTVAAPKESNVLPESIRTYTLETDSKFTIDADSVTLDSGNPSLTQDVSSTFKVAKKVAAAPAVAVKTEEKSNTMMYAIFGGTAAVLLAAGLFIFKKISSKKSTVNNIPAAPTAQPMGQTFNQITPQIPQPIAPNSVISQPVQEFSQPRQIMIQDDTNQSPPQA